MSLDNDAQTGNAPPWPAGDISQILRQSQLILDSYRRWFGRDLVPRSGDEMKDTEALFRCPAIVVSHGTQPDPVLNYGNAAALVLWHCDWATFTKTPSRETAEPMHRDERERLLERTARDGFVDDYQGTRISRGGRRFFIPQAVVFNLIDEQGNYAGQAATFEQFEWLESACPH